MVDGSGQKQTRRWHAFETFDLIISNSNQRNKTLKVTKEVNIMSKFILAIFTRYEWSTSILPNSSFFLKENVR